MGYELHFDEGRLSRLLCETPGELREVFEAAAAAGIVGGSVVMETPWPRTPRVPAGVNGHAGKGGRKPKGRAGRPLKLQRMKTDHGAAVAAAWKKAQSLSKREGISLSEARRKIAEATKADKAAKKTKRGKAAA